MSTAPLRLSFEIGCPATDVELTFVDLGDGTSRLDIVHPGWERLGAQGQPWRAANSSGWTAMAGAFAAAAGAHAGP